MVESAVLILRDGELSPSTRRKRIEDLARKHFDVDAICRRVLGTERKKLSDAEKNQFCADFELYLANYYGTKLDRYDREDVETVKQTPLGRGSVRVDTRLVGGRHHGTPILYFLHRRSGRWLVYDAEIDQVRFVSNFHAQAQSVIRNDGFPALRELVREKSRAGVRDDLELVKDPEASG